MDTKEIKSSDNVEAAMKQLDKQLKNIDTDKINKLSQSRKFYQPNISKPIEVIVPTHPTYETNDLLKEQNLQISELQDSLDTIQYENMKLKAQIEIMNKTIDSDNKKLDELQVTNVNLKAVNQTLKDSNKHYWLYTSLITIAGTILGIILGHYF